MTSDFTHPSQFEIVKFLYQFKDDSKFYKLDESLLKLESQKELYKFVYNLRNNALIGTDCEIYHKEEDHYFPQEFNNTAEIRAKILPRGIAVVEGLLEKDCSN